MDIAEHMRQQLSKGLSEDRWHPDRAKAEQLARNATYFADKMLKEHKGEFVSDDERLMSLARKLKHNVMEGYTDPLETAEDAKRLIATVAIALAASSPLADLN